MRKVQQGVSAGGQDRRPAGLPLKLEHRATMHISRAILIFALTAAAILPSANAAPRDLKLCSAAACECPRQAGGCAPLCRLEPPVACPTT